MPFKNNGPGGCCCGCYFLFDLFDDGLIDQSFRKQEVVWRDTGFGSNVGIGNGYMSVPADNGFLGNFGRLPKYIFEGTGGNSPGCTIPDDRLEKYETMDMGVEEFECSLQSESSCLYFSGIEQEYAYKINADNGTIYCIKLLNSSGTTGESPMSFAIPCVPYQTATGQKFRVKFTNCEWSEHDTVLNGFPENRGALTPVNIYSQDILLDPDEDPWTWVCQTWTRFSRRGFNRNVCSTALPMKFCIAEDELRDQFNYYPNTPGNIVPSSPHIDNRPFSPVGEDSEARLYNWMWQPTSTNEPYSNTGQCPSVKSKIWSRWDWGKSNAQLSLSNTGFDGSFVVERGVNSLLDPWDYSGEYPDESLTQVFTDSGTDYQAVLQGAQVRLDVPGCINIQLKFGWREFGVAPLPPLQSLNYAVIVPVDNPGTGSNIFPKPSITIPDISLVESAASNLPASAQNTLWNDHLSSITLSLTQPF